MLQKEKGHQSYYLALHKPMYTNGTRTRNAKHSINSELAEILICLYNCCITGSITHKSLAILDKDNCSIAQDEEQHSATPVVTMLSSTKTLTAREQTIV